MTGPALERAVDWIPPVVRRLRLTHLAWPFYRLYERYLWQVVASAATPRHLALVLDGNRRYADHLGRDSRAGYTAGAKRVADVLSWSDRAGITCVTLWALSVDNLQRPAEEIGPLTEVIGSTIGELVPLAKAQRWQLRGIGRRELLPDRLRTSVDDAAAATASSDGMIVQFAVGYGGREEILDALRRWSAQSEVAERPTIEAIADLTVEDLGQHLYAPDVAEPDLILRTSGEIRLSGFLLWQSVYSEFYFTDVLWPDFREIDYLRAIRAFQRRSRRFGR